MKKAVIISAIAVVLLLSVAYMLITRLKSNNLDSVTEGMMKRVNNLSQSIEESFDTFIDEADYNLYINNYMVLLSSDDKSSDLYRNFKRFIFKHQDLIEEVTIANSNTIRKISIAENQIELLPVEPTDKALSSEKTLTIANGKAQYIYPVLNKDNSVIGNIIFNLNINNQVHVITAQDNVDKNIWVFFCGNKKIITTQTYNPYFYASDSLYFNQLNAVNSEINRNLSGNSQGIIRFRDQKIPLVFAYHPVSLGNHNFFLVYGIDRNKIFALINYVTITLTIIFAVILFIAVWTFIYFVKRLKKGEERLLRIQTAVDNASDLIIITDMNNNPLFINKALQDIFGRELSPGINPLDLVIPDEKTRKDISEKIDNNKSFICEIDVKNKYEGSTTCLLRADIIHDNDKNPLGIMYMATDIAERKKAERMKNEFISTVSHELRTPLTSIRGSLGLIRGGVTGELSTQAQKLVDIAYTNSERLVRLINDILDIEKIEAGKMELHVHKYELLPLIEKSIEMMRNFANQYNVNIQLNKSIPNIESYIDSDRFEQVMVNLISNAAKFSPAGTSIEIEMNMTTNNIIRISVIDHGIGIPDNFKSMLFKKFAQVDSSDSKAKGGTGLGLSISKAIIEKFGGIIDFESEVNQGSVFYFELPIIVNDTAQEDEPIDITKPRILIVEDDADIASLIKMILEDAGYSTSISYNAEDAKEKLKSYAFSAMTLDLLLPDKQGIQLVQELREDEHTASLPIIVISAVADQQKQQFGSGFDILDWIQKPIDLSRLKRVLQKTIFPTGEEKYTILHVEDDYDNTVIVSQILGERANIIQAHSLLEAKEIVKTRQFEMVILDITLPDGNGMELLPYLRKCGKQSVPVLVFSASETNTDIDLKVAASLVKSKTNNDELVDMIQSILGHQRDKHNSI